MRGWTHDLPEWRVKVVHPTSAADAGAPIDGLDDSALVEAVRQGRREAFDVLVLRHQRTIYRVCYRFAGNHADASDLVQDTFLRAWRGLGGFKREASVGTWLYRIAVNACLNSLAVKTPPMRDVHGLHVADGAEEGASERVLRIERAARVRRAIFALPKRQRATVVLRVYHELPHQEIAAVLRTSVGSVKANLFHGLRNLRRLLQHEPL